MKEVTSISKANVDQQTIDMMEHLLKEAKEGRLISVMFVDKYMDGGIGNGWSGRPCDAMIGKLEDIKFNYLSQKYFPVVDE